MRRTASVSFLTFGFLIAFATAALAGPAGIITGEQTGQFERVDPIVSPGTQSAHEHHFFAVGPVTPDTDTSAEFRQMASSWGTVGNFTGTWLPVLYEDGRRVEATTRKHQLAYYRAVRGIEQVPPEDTAGVSHDCGYRVTTGGGTFTEVPPARSDSGILVVRCRIEGARDLGLTQPFPNVVIYTRLNIGVGPIGNLTLGGPPGSGHTIPLGDMHIDYFWAWDPDVFQRFLDQCVIPDRECGTNPQF